MNRGVGGRDIFIDDHDRRVFVETMERVCKDCRVDIIAYCLMSNHFHLAGKVAKVSLSAVMQRIMTRYATAFNLRHERTGHLFQSRFESRLVHDDAYLQRVIVYIHRNPVKAGLVARAHDWPWSSATRYPEPAVDDDFDPWHQDNKLAAILTRDEYPDAPSLESIAKEICERSGLTVDALLASTRDRAVLAARRLVSRTAVPQGYSLTEIAAWLGVSLMTVSRYCRRPDR